MALEISSKSEQLLCISDAAIHPIHLEQPEGMGHRLNKGPGVGRAVHRAHRRFPRRGNTNEAVPARVSGDPRGAKDPEKGDRQSLRQAQGKL